MHACQVQLGVFRIDEVGHARAITTAKAIKIEQHQQGHNLKKYKSLAIDQSTSRWLFEWPERLQGRDSMAATGGWTENCQPKKTATACHK